MNLHHSKIIYFTGIHTLKVLVFSVPLNTA